MKSFLAAALLSAACDAQVAFPTWGSPYASSEAHLQGAFEGPQGFVPATTPGIEFPRFIDLGSNVVVGATGEVAHFAVWSAITRTLSIAFVDLDFAEAVDIGDHSVTRIHGLYHGPDFMDRGFRYFASALAMNVREPGQPETGRVIFLDLAAPRTGLVHAIANFDVPLAAAQTSGDGFHLAVYLMNNTVLFYHYNGTQIRFFDQERTRAIPNTFSVLDGAEPHIGITASWRGVHAWNMVTGNTTFYSLDGPTERDIAQPIATRFSRLILLANATTYWALHADDGTVAYAFSWASTNPPAPVDFVICNAHAGNTAIWYIGVADILGFTHIYAVNSLTGALIANHHLPPLDFIRVMIVSGEGHHVYGLFEDVVAGTARVGSWHLDEAAHAFEYRFNTGVPGLEAGFGYLASHAPAPVPQIGNQIAVVTRAGFYYLFSPL
jgi:hypothetical protein